MSDEKTKIGASEPVKFIATGKTAVAKIDTGAEISSMHVTSCEVQGESVIFSSPVIGDDDHRFRSTLIRKVNVQNSDGEVEERPVIKVDISIGGKTLNGVEFTLNDRSKNQALVLIGLNALEAGNFVVDPGETPSEEDSMDEKSKKVAEVDEIDVSISSDGQITARDADGDGEAVMSPVEPMSMNLPAEDPVQDVLNFMRERKVKVWQLVERMESSDDEVFSA
jgi:hypothetical protein